MCSCRAFFYVRIVYFLFPSTGVCTGTDLAWLCIDTLEANGSICESNGLGKLDVLHVKIDALNCPLVGFCFIRDIDIRLINLVEIQLFKNYILSVSN